MTEQIGVEAVLKDSDFQAGVARYNSGLSEMTGRTQSFVGTAGAQFGNLGNVVIGAASIISKTFVVAMGAAAVAVGAFTASSVKLAADLQAQMSGVQAVLGATTAEMEMLNQVTLDLALNPNLKVSATEAADAMQMLAQNGLTAGEIAGGAAEATVLLANATGGTFPTAANIATDAMVAFNIGADQMIGAVDGIVSVTDASKFGIEDYGMAISQAGSIVSDLGVEFDDFNATLVATANSFSSGSDAGTSFKTFVQRLVPQSNEAEDAMDALGLSFFDAQGNLKDMSEISADLNQALYGTSTVMVEVGGRTAEQNAELDRLQGLYDRTVTSISDYTTGIKGAGMTEGARASKLEDLNLQLAAIQSQMGPLLGIQGEFIESTKTLTEEERNRYLTSIFGSDAIRTALGLAEAGAVVYTDAAQAARELGVSQAEVNKVMEGGVTQFEALQLQMSKTDALEAARVRMDNLKGAVEIFSGIVEAIKLQIGNAFLPILQSVVEQVSAFVAENQEKFVAFFTAVATGISTFTTALMEGADPLDAFVSSLEAMNVPQGTIDKIVDFADAITEMATVVGDFVSEHADALSGALAGVGAVLALAAGAAILGPILAAILSPLGLIIAGAAALGAAINTNFAGLGDAVSNIAASIQDGSITFQSAWNEIATVAGNIWTMIEPHLITLGQNILTWFSSIDWAGIGTTLWTAVQTQFQTLWTNITTWFSSQDWGGIVMTAVNALIAGFGQLGAMLGEAGGNLQISLIEWLNTVDWVAFGESFMTFIGNAIVGAIALLAGYTATAAMSVYSFISSYMAAQDWPAIGINLYTAVLNALSGFASGVGNVLSGWYQSFVTWVSGVDWAGIGQSIIDFIVDSLTRFDTFVSSTLQGWYTTFTTWVAGIDWQQVGYDLMTFIIYALDEFPQEVSDTLVSWFTAFTDWGQDQDWEGMASNVVTQIITALTNFVNEVGPVLAGWYNAFVSWFTSQDWGALAQAAIDGIVNGISNGAAAVGSAVSSLVQGMVQAAVDALASHSPSKVTADQIGTPFVQGIAVGIATSGPLIPPVVDDVLNDATQRAMEKAKAAGHLLGGGVAGGILDGMRESGPFIPPVIEDVVSKITGGILDSMRQSGPFIPPVLTDVITKGTEEVDSAEIGASLAEILIAGMMATLESSDTEVTIGDRLEALFDLGSTFASFGNAVVKRFEQEVLDPIQDGMDQLDDDLENRRDRRDSIMDAIAQIAGIQADQVNASLPDLTLLARTTGNTHLLNFIHALGEANLEIAQTEQERVRLAEEYAAEQQRILDLQKQQQDLQFLQQQLDLLNMIREAGLNPADILGGLELGLDASLPELIEAMSAAIGAVVQAANQELQIASPSQVFANIGKQVMVGLQKGLEQAANLPIRAMDNALTTLSERATIPLQPTFMPAPAVNVNGGSETTQYNLSLNTRSTDISVRRAFRVMELSRA